MRADEEQTGTAGSITVHRGIERDGAWGPGEPPPDALTAGMLVLEGAFGSGNPSL